MKKQPVEEIFDWLFRFILMAGRGLHQTQQDFSLLP